MTKGQQNVNPLGGTTYSTGSANKNFFEYIYNSYTDSNSGSDNKMTYKCVAFFTRSKVTTVHDHLSSNYKGVRNIKLTTCLRFCNFLHISLEKVLTGTTTRRIFNGRNTRFQFYNVDRNMHDVQKELRNIKCTKEVCRQIGIPKSTLRRLQNKPESITLCNFLRLCNYQKKSIDQILT